MDVSKTFVENLWIGTSKENGWMIDVEYIGNNTYCEYCSLLRHTIGLCRRKIQADGKLTVTEEKKPASVGTKNKHNTEWVVKGRAPWASIPNNQPA